MSSPAPQDDHDIREYDRRVYGDPPRHGSGSQSRSHQPDIKPRLGSPSHSPRSSHSSPRPYPRIMPSSATHARAADAASSGSGSGSGETMTGAGESGAGFSRSYPPAHNNTHHSSTRARSPSGPSLSSHRSHPYRRLSSSLQASERDSARDLPRIHFPYPPGSSAGPLTPSSGGVPPLSSLALDGSRDRAALPRTHSGNGAINRGLNLPPLHSISGNSPPGHHQPYPYDRSPTDGYARTHSPQLPHSSHGPPPTGRSSRESPNLRPSYNYNYDAYPTPSHTSPIDRETPSRHYPPEHYTPASAHHTSLPPPPPSAHGHGQPHRGSRDQAYRRPSPQQDYPESPPLRAVTHEYHPHPAHSYAHAHNLSLSNSHRPPSQSHHSYTQPPAGYYPPPDGYPHAHAGLARSRSHSTSRMIDEPTPGPGQNRRIAHLMSEQKRRESINSGFQSLRDALPGALPTDSKAIILRKAVAHIKHIEGMLHKAGVNPTTAAGSSTSGGSGPALTPSSWDEEGEEGRDVDMDEREVRGKWEDERRGWPAQED